MKHLLASACKAAITMGGMLAVSTPSAASLRDQPEVFFQPGPQAPKELSATRLYPQGKRVPFAIPSPAEGWSAGETAEVERLGIMVFDQESSGPAALEKGLPTVVGVGLSRTSGTESEPVEIAFRDREEVAAQVAAQVKKAAENPDIAFWNLLPGEIRFRDKHEMAYLAAASRAVAQNDPLKRPIWTRVPAEATTAYLSHMAPWVDYLGKTLDPGEEALKHSRIWFRWGVERAVEAIHETSAKATPVAVPVAPEVVDEAEKIAANLRHDLYLSFVTGAKGVIALAPRPAAQPAAPMQRAFREACLRVASELLGPEKLGEVFLFGERREQIEVDIVDGPAEVGLLYPAGGVKKPMAYTTVSHLDLAYGDKRYLILVNSALEPVTLMIGGMPYAAVTAESLFNADPVTDIAEGEFETSLNPLEVRIYRMTRR